MGKETGIAWCHHTFNFAWGCTKVSEACRDCYAEKWAERTGFKIWGQDAPRRFFGDKHWHEPRVWNEDAKLAGERRRVFCSSMADVFEQLPEDHPQREEMQDARGRLWKLIESTPWLDWLLLTKRPENVLEMVPLTWLPWALRPLNNSFTPEGTPTEGKWPRNAWLGFTAENQERFDERWAHAQDIPAPVIFVSVEPQLGEVMPPEEGPAPDWFIQGGESGARGRVRPFYLPWHHQLLAWCRRRGRAYFLKQMGTDLAHQLGLVDRKGEDPSEWPEEFRIQEFPTPRAA